MDRERRVRREGEDLSGADAIAGRLDRLNADQAEAVIRRAIELTDEENERFEYGRLDADTLETVAAELGIPARHVQRAIAEQRVALHDPDDEASIIDRIFGITDLDEAAVVDGDRGDVELAMTTWMESHEGLRVKRHTVDGAVWMKDERPLTAIKMGLGMTHGSKTLRGTGEVEHAIRTIGEREHLVSMTVSKRLLRAVAVWGSLGIATVMGVLGLVLGLTVGLGVGLAVALVGGGAGLAGLWGGVRSWAGRVRDAVDRAVAAVIDPDRSGVFDTLPGRLGGWLKSMGVAGSRKRSGGRSLRR